MVCDTKTIDEEKCRAGEGIGRMENKCEREKKSKKIKRAGKRERERERE